MLCAAPPSWDASGMVRTTALLLGLGWAAAAQAQVPTSSVPLEIDRAVAWVNGRVITLSELVLEARLALRRCALGAEGFSGDCGVPLGHEGRFLWSPHTRGAALDALARGPGDPSVGPTARAAGELLASVLELSIRRRLLADEARRLELRAPTQDELEEALQALVPRPDRRSLGAGLEAARALGYAIQDGRPPPLLEQLLAAELLTVQLIELRARAIPRVEASVLLACASALGVNPDANRAALGTAITQARREARVRRIVLQLREGAQIAYAVPFLPQVPAEVPECPDRLPGAR